jgi:hypothetical protein
MKYGNILKENIENEYEKYYIPYNKIKKNIFITSEFFIVILSKYCDITDKFYKDNKSKKELIYFCLLNVFSILKITKKYNKKNNCNITDEIKSLLFKQTFYKDLIYNHEIFRWENGNTCDICYDTGNYTIDMECCKHSICWNCLIRCYLNNFERCNYCRCKMDTNPFIVALNKLTKTKNPFYHKILGYKEPKKVLVIGIDGLRPDALLYADTPSMDAVIQSGVFNFDTIVEEDTISGPSWASILTGTTQSETGVNCNTQVENKKFKCKKDIFTTLKTKGISTTAFISNWIGMWHLVQNSENKYFSNTKDVYKNDSNMIDGCNKYLDCNNIGDEFVFLYLNGVDDYGHKYGFSIQSEQYIQYIEDLDRRLLKTYYLAKERGWSIVILTDHGGCTKADLDEKTTNIFDSVNFVSGQVDKQCKGVHGLDIPQHKRTFKIFNGPIVNGEKREIMGRLDSRSSYDEIVNYFDKL